MAVVIQALQAGFTACGKTHPGGRPGIYPRYKANQISVGFSPCGMLCVHIVGKWPFFAPSSTHGLLTHSFRQAGKSALPLSSCLDALPRHSDYPAW
jgi:hypothetical protein